MFYYSIVIGRGKLFGIVVRLVFHDAGEFDIRTSDLLGPDGCLSNTNDNKGLIESTSLVMTVLEPLWQQVCEYITRADYWVMFAKLVIEEATSNSITVSYQYGRKDNFECSVYGETRLPSGQSGMSDIEQIFITQMGLTIQDAGTSTESSSSSTLTSSPPQCIFALLSKFFFLDNNLCIFYKVALLGGHSLGYTTISNSGYGFNIPNADLNILNAWDSTPHVLDSGYFSELIQKVIT